MTGQVADRVRFDGHEYNLAGVKGGVLFEPQQLGLEPEGRCTACWRGYESYYVVEDGRLLLARLEVTLGDWADTVDTPFGPRGKRKFTLKEGPELHGVKPIKPRSEYARHNNLYDGLNLEVQYTGSILIADHFIRSLYVHMGFQPAWKYETVLELTLEEGKLVQVRDVSGKIKILRDILRQMPLGSAIHPDLATALAWVDSTFSLDYEL